MSNVNNLHASIIRFDTFLRFLLTGIRIVIGWHFLYEGISKLFAPNWTSAGYLLTSHWVLSGFFHWVVENPSVLKIVDLLNIWGLIFVGFGLFFGILTRIASLAGTILLFLYFIANPPFVGFIGQATGEGNYLVVNKNIIEMMVLMLFIVVPKNLFYGVDRWFSRLSGKQADTECESQTTRSDGRREFLKDMASLPLFGGFVYAVINKKQWESFEERHLISQPSRLDALTGASTVGGHFADLKELKSKVPCGKLGDYEISRLICGGNLISGYAHSRDLIYVSSLIQSYFTDEKVMETMRLCEACGINTIILRVDKNTLRIMKKYRRRNGKIHWIAQIKIKEDDIKSDIDAAIDNSAMGVYIQGNISDEMVAKGRVDLLAKTLDYMKTKKVLTGIAGHELAVTMACEQAGLEPDFHMKTLNSANYWTAGPRLITDPNWQPDPFKKVVLEYNKKTNDNIWCETPQQTVEFMKHVKKPWIAYKVLGAGAIRPKEGFQYAFDNGADFICVGMFDFQVVQDANIVNEVLKQNLQRIRPWMV